MQWTCSTLRTLCCAMASMLVQPEHRSLGPALSNLVSLCRATRGRDKQAAIACHIMCAAPAPCTGHACAACLPSTGLPYVPLPRGRHDWLTCMRAM